jgi:sulfur-oxidizing protein SoxB
MVRVGGLQYTIAPNEKMGNRISAMTLNGKPIDANKNYKVAGWAPVAEAARESKSPPIWDVVAGYLRDKKTIQPNVLNLPKLVGVQGNAGIAS